MNSATKLRIFTTLIFLLVVEIVCRIGWIDQLVLIPPTEMIVGLFNLIREGSINFDIASSLLSILIAASSAIVVGFLVGVILHALPRLRAAVDPLLSSYYSVPIFVFYPLFIVLLGLNNGPKIAIGFLSAVVTMITNTCNGLDRVPKVLRKTARSFQMDGASANLLVILPASSPYIFSGVKLALAHAFVGVLGSEFILSASGIGYEISYAFNDFDNVKMYALISLILLLVGTVNIVMFSWEKRLLLRRGQW